MQKYFLTFVIYYKLTSRIIKNLSKYKVLLVNKLSSFNFFLIINNVISTLLRKLVKYLNFLFVTEPVCGA